MEREQFLSLGFDADHAAMAMDRRPVIDRIKDLIKNVKNRNDKWNALPTVIEEVTNPDIDDY